MCTDCLRRNAYEPDGRLRNVHEPGGQRRNAYELDDWPRMARKTGQVAPWNPDAVRWSARNAYEPNGRLRNAHGPGGRRRNAYEPNDRPRIGFGPE